MTAALEILVLAHPVDIRYVGSIYTQLSRARDWNDLVVYFRTLMHLVATRKLASTPVHADARPLSWSASSQNVCSNTRFALIKSERRSPERTICPLSLSKITISLRR